MFKIYDGREAFYQWDINQKLIVGDDSITEVHFSNRTNSYSLVCDIQNEGDLRVVSVPNVLLQTNWPIKVYAYRKDHTEVSETFKVIEKEKPEDYIYTPDEIKTWEELNNRITELEQSESVLYTAQELTEEQKAQARQNIGAQDENNGFTPVNVTYVNPFYGTTDTSTAYLLQGTLKVFDDNSPTDVKKAFAVVMNVLGGRANPTGTASCRDLFDKLRILYDNGLITIPFKAYPNKYDRNYWVSLSFAYQNTSIIFNCVRSDKADGFNVTLRYDLETNAYEEQSCYSEQAVKSYLKGLTGTPTIAQVQIQSDPTADKEIATKHYVDNAPVKKASATELGGVKVGTGLAIANDGTLSMNIASATVGQIIKVKAVDENGKPTEWEAVDMPSGGGGGSGIGPYRFIQTVTIPDGENVSIVDITIPAKTRKLYVLGNTNTASIFGTTVRTQVRNGDTVLAALNNDKNMSHRNALFSAELYDNIQFMSFCSTNASFNVDYPGYVKFNDYASYFAKENNFFRIMIMSGSSTNQYFAAGCTFDLYAACEE